MVEGATFHRFPGQGERISDIDEQIAKGAGSPANTKILCLDTEPEVTEGLKNAGYSVYEASMGFRTGKRDFRYTAPNEVDIIVCDLKRPACFDSREWGGIGQNNSRFCKIVQPEKVTNEFRLQNGRRVPIYKMIYESQLGAQIPGTFGPKDVNSAIIKGGIPFLLFLNREWLSKVDLFPNWLDLRWTFLPTTATQVSISSPLSSLVPEIGSQARLKLAIVHRIESGPLSGRNTPPFVTCVMPIVTNNVGHVFGQFIRMGRGSVWLVPSTHQNTEVVALVASRLRTLHQLTFQPEEILLTRGTDHETALTVGTSLRSKERRENVADTSIKIFISHSSEDVAIAQALIHLLKDAIPELGPASIRCTSVPGYKLQGGVQTDDQLRREMRYAPVFIGLLTKESLASTYVLFELGARWGAGSKFTPLVAAGLQMSALKPPLAGMHAQSCDSETDVQQMLNEISGWLDLKLAGAHIYDAHLKGLLAASSAMRKR